MRRAPIGTDNEKIFKHGPLAGRKEYWYEHVPICSDDPSCFRNSCGYSHPARDSKQIRWEWVYPSDWFQPPGKTTPSQSYSRLSEVGTRGQLLEPIAGPEGKEWDNLDILLHHKQEKQFGWNNISLRQPFSLSSLSNGLHPELGEHEQPLGHISMPFLDDSAPPSPSQRTPSTPSPRQPLSSQPSPVKKLVASAPEFIPSSLIHVTSARAPAAKKRRGKKKVSKADKSSAAPAAVPAAAPAGPAAPAKSAEVKTAESMEGGVKSAAGSVSSGSLFFASGEISAPSTSSSSVSMSASMEDSSDGPSIANQPIEESTFESKLENVVPKGENHVESKLDFLESSSEGVEFKGEDISLSLEPTSPLSPSTPKSGKTSKKKKLKGGKISASAKPFTPTSDFNDRHIFLSSSGGDEKRGDYVITNEISPAPSGLGFTLLGGRDSHENNDDDDSQVVVEDQHLIQDAHIKTVHGGDKPSRRSSSTLHCEVTSTSEQCLDSQPFSPNGTRPNTFWGKICAFFILLISYFMAIGEKTQNGWSWLVGKGKTSSSSTNTRSQGPASAQKKSSSLGKHKPS